MDRQSFIELLEGHADRVYSYARWVLQDPEDAADVVQEAFLRLWERGGDLEEKGRVAWLQRVAHNLCVDRRRRTSTWRRRLSHLARAAPAELPTGRRAGSDPEQDLLLDERQQTLLAALGSLPGEIRSVLVMHYYEGLKYREIAEILDSNENAVKARVHRGRQALRRILTGSGNEDLAARRETG